MDGTLTTAKIPASNQISDESRAGLFAGRRGRKTKEALLAYLFLLPAFVLVGLFGLFPLLFAAYQSTLRGINRIDGSFTGLDNYVTAIYSLTYVLGFLGGVGLIFYAGYTIWEGQRQSKVDGDKFWLWLPAGTLIGAGIVSAICFILAILPKFLAIPATLRGAQGTAANYRHAIWQAFLDPTVQTFFWIAVATIVLGAVLQNRASKVRQTRAQPANYAGTFTFFVLLVVGAITLLWLTWEQLVGDMADAIASGAPVALGTQIITMMAGVLLFILSWVLWTSAQKRDSTISTVLRLVAAALLMIGGWMLFAELPLAIARGDALWWNGLAATFWYSVGTIPPQLLIALLLAVLLFQKIRGRGLFRMLYFLPYIAPFVGTAAVFRLLFSARSSGAVNSILGFFGIPPLAWLNEPTGIFDLLSGPVNIPGWMEGPSLALVVIMIYGVWSFFGFNTVIFLAGLGSIPQETYEAASIDGATKWAQFRHITLPLLSPTLYFLTLYSVIGTFKAFNHIYVLRTGAALGTTDTASVVIFNVFKRDLRFGYASALSILLLLIIIVLTVVNNRIASKRVFYG
jgi:multiple sugar transport system permease protein